METHDGNGGSFKFSYPLLHLNTDLIDKKGSTGVSNRDLSLPVGATITMHPSVPGLEHEYTAEVIGYVTDQSLLISFPKCDGEPVPLAEGDEFTVQYGDDETGYTFETAVIQVCIDPYPYAHLQYPNGVQGVIIRSAQRIPVKLPVILLSAESGSGKKSVAMLDISISGARLVAYDRLGNVGDRFSIDMAVPTSKEEERINIPVIVRYVREESRENKRNGHRYHHGVEFLTLDEGANLFIQQFVTEQISSNRRQGT